MDLRVCDTSLFALFSTAIIMPTVYVVKERVVGLVPYEAYKYTKMSKHYIFRLHAPSKGVSDEVWAVTVGVWYRRLTMICLILKLDGN